MQNNYSRRDFIKASTAATVGAFGGAVGTAGLLGTSSCGKDLTFAIPLSVMNLIGSMSYSSTMNEYKQANSVVQQGAPGSHHSMVHNSGKRIETATKAMEKESKWKGFAWQYELINDKTVNAWCMPGARIAFYEGIMPLCKNEAGVAAVMGHEVAHAIQNHAGRRMAWQLTLQLGITSLSALMSKIDVADPAVMNIALQVFGLGGQLGLLAYSRSNEYEADKMGLMYMAKAGYDPREAPDFWRRMQAQFGKGGSDFLSTHPSNENRIKELERALPEAVSLYESSS